jgi:hypothetical protein
MNAVSLPQSKMVRAIDAKGARVAPGFEDRLVDGANFFHTTSAVDRAVASA